MTKKVMKGLVVMMMMVVVVVLAILVQVLVKADNSSFSYVSPNHPPSLTPSPHSLPIISLSPYEMDAKPQKINHSRRKNTHKETKIPGSEIKKEERKCLDYCTKIIKVGRLYVSLIKILYKLCIRKCLGYT
jgi:hypothetical protein